MEKQVEDFFRSIEEKGYDKKEIMELLFNSNSIEEYMNVKKDPVIT